MSQRVVVTGAGGFIGHHLVRRLKKDGHWVRGVDLVRPGFGESEADEFELLDLRRKDDCLQALRGAEHVYALAADMGGMGFISGNHATILHNNALINLHTIDAARVHGVQRYLFTSSACIYPHSLQTSAEVAGLKEEDAYPADVPDGYGWEKLTSERACAYYTEEHGLETRVARFHNIYGPEGTWRGGREKVPAAMCRKVAAAKLSGDPRVEVWGDGLQTRSFCYIDDCVEGLVRLMASDHRDPLNLGDDRGISVNGLLAMVAEHAGVDVERVHVEGPQGVRGRNSDNTRLAEVLGWRPEISLEEGMGRTYDWIEGEVRARLEAGLPLE